MRRSSTRSSRAESRATFHRTAQQIRKSPPGRDPRGWEADVLAFHASHPEFFDEFSLATLDTPYAVTAADLGDPPSGLVLDPVDPAPSGRARARSVVSPTARMMAGGREQLKGGRP